MTSSRPLPPPGGLDLELLHAILKVTRSARLRAIIRDLLRGAELRDPHRWA